MYQVKWTDKSGNKINKTYRNLASAVKKTYVVSGECIDLSNNTRILKIGGKRI